MEVFSITSMIDLALSSTPQVRPALVLLLQPLLLVQWIRVEHHLILIIYHQRTQAVTVLPVRQIVATVNTITMEFAHGVILCALQMIPVLVQMLAIAAHVPMIVMIMEIASTPAQRVST
jgi:hypothetical protein